MGDLLKVIAAVVLVGAAVKYAAHHVVNKAIADSGEPDSGYPFECKPLEIPETNFNWNANWATGAGIVCPGGGTEKSRMPAASVDTEPARSIDVNTARLREMREQAREMHEAIRNGGDPKREMERMRERMRMMNSNR